MHVHIKQLIDWIWKLVEKEKYPQLDPLEKDLLYQWTVWPLWREEFDGVQIIQLAGSSTDTSD